jgi:hypothetical protein
MSLRNELVVLDEPLLEFRHGQHAVDPHRGLSLFGPYDADRNPPGRIRYGVVGTPEGIAAFAAFAEAMAGPIAGGATDEDLAHPGSARNRLRQNALWPVFPGFSTAFLTRWQATPLTTGIVSAEAIDAARRNRDDHQRVRRIADLFLEPIRIASERDDPPQVVVCVVPDRVWLDCRPMSRVSAGEGVRPNKAQVAQRRMQPDLFGDYDPDDYDLSTDFRLQIKARALAFRMPTQLITHSTVDLTNNARMTKTPVSDRAWNLGTSLYFKSGGKPWNLANPQSGSSFLGLNFGRWLRRDGTIGASACSAHLFRGTAEEVVFAPSTVHRRITVKKRATIRWDATTLGNSSPGC